jgi:hypothetical protein
MGMLKIAAGLTPAITPALFEARPVVPMKTPADGAPLEAEGSFLLPYGCTRWEKHLRLIVM